MDVLFVMQYDKYQCNYPQCVGHSVIEATYTRFYIFCLASIFLSFYKNYLCKVRVIIVRVLSSLDNALTRFFFFFYGWQLDRNETCYQKGTKFNSMSTEFEYIPFAFKKKQQQQRGIETLDLRHGGLLASIPHFF